MTTRIDRRTVLGYLGLSSLATAGAMAMADRPGVAAAAEPIQRKGRIKHSVCRWCYKKLSLEDLCQAAKDLGIQSIELTGPQEWPVLKKFGLTCAMGSGAGMGIAKGFNRIEHHDQLVADFEKIIPEAAAAGVPSVICMSGNRAGQADDEGLKNCALCLKRLMKTAEKHQVNVVMELLNSRVNHKDYQCDHTEWGAEMCRQVGSERCKLLYDIYHMQIMEGDLIATIRKNIQYIGHFHTGGVPGRAEIDETQEIYYPAVMRAIADLKYQGYVGQEFIPKRPDAIASLKQAIDLCDV